MREQKSLFIDPSILSLLAANLATIYFAISQGWSILLVMWIYWFQSIIIGFFNFIRILQLKEFSTEGFMINNKPAAPTETTKLYTAFFFLFHYGFFHFGYAFFLRVGFFGDGDNFRYIALEGGQMNYVYFTAILFFINHFISYIFNKPKDNKKQNIGTLMAYPYARILPMHLTVLLGGFFTQTIMIFFLFLKTIADVVMHIIEHKLRRG